MFFLFAEGGLKERIQIMHFVNPSVIKETGEELCWYGTWLVYTGRGRVSPRHRQVSILCNSLAYNLALSIVFLDSVLFDT